MFYVMKPESESAGELGEEYNVEGIRKVFELRIFFICLELFKYRSSPRIFPTD